ncbi:MAG: CHAT domain-containing protein [Sphingobacteriaceae bacterium]|nr:CHAT domain-containing protein [Sphingobacteriaceae bacterium]
MKVQLFLIFFLCTGIYTKAQDFGKAWSDFSKKMEKENLPIAVYEEFEKKYEKKFADFANEATHFYSSYAYALLNVKDQNSALEALKYSYHYSTQANDTTLKHIVVYRFGDYYRLTGNYIEAEKYYLGSLSTLAVILGESNREYSQIYFEYLQVLMFQGKYAEAKPGVEALIYYYKTLDGEKSLEYAHLNNNLADIYQYLGEYQKSIEILKPLLENKIFLELKDTAAYIESYSNLGDVYREAGDCNSAIILFKKAKEEFYTYRLNQLPILGSIVNNMGLCYKMNGEIKEAEESFDSALLLYDKANHNNTNDYCVTLNNKGDLYRELGRYGYASEILLKSLTIRKTYLDTNSKVYANTLNNLGLIYFDAGFYDEALRRLNHALLVYERTVGTQHQFYGNCINNISSLNFVTGEYKLAKENKIKALAITENSVGKDHYRYINFLISLSSMHVRLADYKLAEKSLMEAGQLAKKNFGLSHELYVRAQFGLAEILATTGRFEEATSLYNESIQYYIKKIDTYFCAMSEENQAHYLSLFESVFQSYNLFVLNYKLSHPQKNINALIKQVLKNQLLIKSLLGKNASGLQKQISKSNNQELKSVYDDWKIVKNQLINLNKSGQNDSLENELVKKVSQMETYLKQNVGAIFEVEHVDMEQLQKHLSKDEALVEIFKTTEWVSDTTYQAKYGAILIHKNKLQPELFVFNNGNELENTKFQLYTQAIENELIDSLSYSVYFEKIDKNLKGIQKLYVSADGVYQKINLNGLFIANQHKFIFDKYQVLSMPNLAGIIQNTSSLISTHKSAQLFGYPDYEYNFNTPSVPTIEQPLAIAKRYGLTELSKLPGTKIEVNEIGQILQSAGWSVKSYLNENASEKNLREINSPRILHIATHGFYLKNIESTDPFFLGFERSRLKENSYLRSGIILAGAIPSSADSVNSNTENDGILTAYDALLLDLHETELVVLSACQTGLGDNMGSQGVAGLQRSFAIAGAKNIIMSLWPVDDEATKFLMTTFYQQFAKSNSIENSFIVAQNACKLKYPHPAYWAAFVLLKGL